MALTVADKDTIDLLMPDVIIPRMNGKVLNEVRREDLMSKCSLPAATQVT